MGVPNRGVDRRPLRRWRRGDVPRRSLRALPATRRSHRRRIRRIRAVTTASSLSASEAMSWMARARTGFKQPTLGKVGDEEGAVFLFKVVKRVCLTGEIHGPCLTRRPEPHPWIRIPLSCTGHTTDTDGQTCTAPCQDQSIVSFYRRPWQARGQTSAGLPHQSERGGKRAAMPHGPTPAGGL